MAVAGEAGPQGLIPTTDSFGTALADIVRCGVCGHMQLATMPSEESLADAYGDAASADYVEEEEGQRATARAVLGRLAAAVPAGSGSELPRLLEVGCWVGFLLDEARAAGYAVEGIEPSGFAAAYARERFGLEVQEASLAAATLPDGAFAAIVMGDVIEHLIDPGGALQRCRELLAPGGALALVLPDSGSALARAMGRRWWSVIPTHVQYFTRHSLTRLLEREGFELLDVATSPKAFTVSYYLGRLGGYSEGVAAAATRAAERMGVAERVWAPDFGDRMIAVARARA
jgi:SAM-dependent methyltransferase